MSDTTDQCPQEFDFVFPRRRFILMITAGISSSQCPSGHGGEGNARGGRRHCVENRPLHPDPR